MHTTCTISNTLLNTLFYSYALILSTKHSAVLNGGAWEKQSLLSLHIVYIYLFIIIIVVDVVVVVVYYLYFILYCIIFSVYVY